MILLFNPNNSIFIHNPHHHNGRVNISVILLCLLSKKIFFLSEASMNVFNHITFGSFHNKARIVTHPLTNASDKPEYKINNSRSCKRFDLVFTGRDRGNRGLKELTKVCEKYKLKCTIYSQTTNKNSKYVTYLNKFLVEDEFIKLLARRDIILVLPYINATQSGIFYSALANRTLIISTATSDIASKLTSHGLCDLIYSKTEPESLIRAVKYCTENHKEVRMKLDKLAFEIDERFQHESKFLM